MQQQKILCVAAWTVTAAAALTAVYSTVTGRGGVLCAFFMTVAIVLQSAYAKEYKGKKHKNEELRRPLSSYRRKKP